MAAQVLPPGSGGSFLDSPVFNHRRTKPPPTGFGRRDANPPMAALRFDTSDLEGGTSSQYSLTSQLNTPDSGFSGAASSSVLKTPESDISSTAVTPPSGGSGSGQRKRKTVTIDESQTSIVMISPDDLFNTYSKLQGQSHYDGDVEEEEGNAPRAHKQQQQQQQQQPQQHQAECSQDLVSPDDDHHIRFVMDTYTGWPLKRSDSLESRDNPFLPGGELSREAEDLLSRATIIRDHFYLNEEEKRTLREQQLKEQQELQQQQQQQQQQQKQKQQRGTKHVQIKDHHDGSIHYSNASGPDTSPPAAREAVEERISPQTSANALAAAAPASSSPNGGDSHQLQPRENGKVGDVAAASPDNVKLAIPDGEGQSLPAGQTGASQTSPPGGGDLQVQDSDKKRRNKCCSIM